MEISKDDRDRIICAHLETPEGKKRFKQAFQKANAWAADQFKEGTLAWYFGRHLAGLPFKYVPLKLGYRYVRRSN